MYFQQVPSSPIQVLVEGDVFYVELKKDMMELWNSGFFGKGSFSRSEPTWGSRSEPSKELITEKRREDRKKYKELRAKHQVYETQSRRGEAVDSAEWALIRAEMAKLKQMQIYENVPVEHAEGTEYLQLQKEEALFLTMIGAIDCGIAAIDFFPRDPSDAFVKRYAVYHHFRSRGWCVRSGVKFGCDFLLYARGPPFAHAEFGVIIAGQPRWEDVMACGRVIGGVKKTVVFVSVETQSSKYCRALACGDCEQVLAQVSVSEVLFKRWSPTRTRD